MLKGPNVSRRIKIGTYASGLTLDDILFLFECNQHKIKQENNTDEKFEFGIVNKTRYRKTVKYTLNLGWICCKAELTDSWLQRSNSKPYFHEQKSMVKWNLESRQNTSRQFSSYDAGPLLQQGVTTSTRVRQTVDRITEMCHKITGR